MEGKYNYLAIFIALLKKDAKNFNDGLKLKKYKSNNVKQINESLKGERRND